MFTIPSDKIDFLKQNGLYDYLIDMEDSGNISRDDKEEIYQYILADSVQYMSKTDYSKFVDGLVHTLEMKKKCGC